MPLHDRETLDILQGSHECWFSRMPSQHNIYPHELILLWFHSHTLLDDGKSWAYVMTIDKLSISLIVSWSLQSADCWNYAVHHSVLMTFLPLRVIHRSVKMLSCTNCIFQAYSGFLQRHFCTELITCEYCCYAFGCKKELRSSRSGVT